MIAVLKIWFSLAVLSINDHTLSWGSNPSQGTAFNFTYYAEYRLVSVSGDATATFVYDGDGKRVLSTMDGATTLFVGAHYEKIGSSVTKYYLAGASRVAVRTGSTLSYLLADHLSQNAD